MAARPGKLSFKGDSGATNKPKKKRKHNAEAAAAEPEPLEGWVDATTLEDVTGPVLLLTAATDPPSILGSSADSSLITLRRLEVEASLSSVEPETVQDVFVAKRIDPTRPAVVAFKTPSGFHLGSDKFGIVGAEREAVGGTEEWELIRREDGFGLQNVYGKFLKADRDAAPRGGGAVRADSDSIGFAEIWRIRMQASARAATKKAKLAERPEDLQALEVETLKSRQSWGLGRVKVAGDLAELREAKKEGKIHEALLDRRAKVKSDKFCK